MTPCHHMVEELGEFRRGKIKFIYPSLDMESAHYDLLPSLYIYSWPQMRQRDKVGLLQIGVNSSGDGQNKRR